jgi:hypothetical protein
VRPRQLRAAGNLIADRVASIGQEDVLPAEPLQQCRGLPDPRL